MKDNLTDLVNHTHVLGNVSFLKIVGTDKITEFQSVADDKSVIIQGKFKDVIPEFNGVFGMPNLTKLNIILNIPEYDTDATIVVNTQTKNGETVPSGLRFENKAADFKNDYRFMSTEIVNEKLKDLKAKSSIKWNVSVQPSVANIQRFKFQSQANSEEPVFVAKTDGSKLKFHFGDPSSMNGEFVFDELGLKTWNGSPDNLRLITHVIFHPVQKSLNRQIQIDYTLRIQTLTNLSAA